MHPNGFYWNAERGELRHRVAAGGHGGGVTGQADIAATPEQVVAWFKLHPHGDPALDKATDAADPYRGLVDVQGEPDPV